MSKITEPETFTLEHIQNTVKIYSLKQCLFNYWSEKN